MKYKKIRILIVTNSILLSMLIPIVTNGIEIFIESGESLDYAFVVFTITVSLVIGFVANIIINEAVE